MKKVSNLLLGYPAFVSSYLKNYPFKKEHLLFLIAMVLIVSYGKAQTNNYFGSSGNISSAAWSTNPAGPYNTSLNTTGGAIINFGNAATVIGATIDIRGINATANVTAWIGGGTFGTGGTVVPVNVSGGVTLNMLSQAISSAAGTGFNKSGAGVLAISTGSAYTGGFTLSDGTIIIGGVNAMGANTLNLNGGIVAADGNRDLGGKYPGGISIGGNVQFGEVTGLASNTSNLSFTNNISLGSTNPTLTMGNTGTASFGGVFSGTGGISFTKNISGTGIFDMVNTANVFSGNVNINGGLVRFAADGSFGNAGNTIVIDGGQLLANNDFSILHAINLGTSAGTGINVPSGTLTIDGVISDRTILGSFTKFGAGSLVLKNANTYTGKTYIATTGGILQLNRPGGNTLPSTNDALINGGTFQISTDQTLNDLSLVNGSLVVDNGVTLTINGIFDFFQPGIITIVGNGKIIYGPAGVLKYSGTIAKMITSAEFPVSGGPYFVNCNNPGGIILPFNRTLNGGLLLTTGIFTIGAGVRLDLDGASLNSLGGYLAGNAIVGSTAELTIRGNAGGVVALPTNINIGLNNLSIDGTRVVALNGTNHLVLSGTLTISNGAIFDNGGESQITNGGAAGISISGTFVTRDLEGFSGPATAIPGISPILNDGCTIEYGRAGNQNISIRSDYKNLRFTGGGIKSLSVANSIAPIVGTVTIPDATILDVSNNTFGSVLTNFKMMNGRFRVSGTGTKPDMDGAYDLSGNSVIEFYNSGTALNETIRGKNAAANNILYNQIEVTGNKVGNSNSNITINSNGIFRVKSGGVFEINDNSIIAAPTTTGQSVVVENNALFLCGNNRGFNGFTPTITDNSSIHPNITNIALATGTPGSTVNYTRAGDQPITIANALEYSNLILSGSGMKIAPSGTLNIHGNLSKISACSFESNNGKVLFNNSTTAQTISSTVPPIFNFYDLSNSNTSATGLNFTNNIAIIHALELTANSKLNFSTADINLLSSAFSTARVARVPSSAVIEYSGIGRWVVERYFPAARSWRLITSPLSSNNTPTTIFSQWQQDGNYTPGRGVFITGPNPAYATNGLDDSYFDSYSGKTYQNNAFVNMGNTLTSLSNSGLKEANIGYFIFVRGDRSRSPDNTVFPNTNATTLSSRGKLQTGTQTFPGFTRTTAGQRNFALVGNPYASPVDFNSLTRVNLLKRFIVWDPKINQVGAYVYLDDPDNDGVYSINPSSPGNQGLDIQSGQAFFVETDAAIGPASITFNESSKSTVNNQGMFRPVTATNFFRSFLYQVNADSTTRLVDGNLAEFGGSFHDSVDFQDALKFININETFGLTRNKTSIAIERRPAIEVGDTLFFNLTRTSQRSYQFRFEPGNFDPLLSAFIEDDFTGSSTPISLTSTSNFNFVINGNAGSDAANRFRVVFRRIEAAPLPVSFIDLKAWKQANSIALEWKVENEINISKYEVEKSEDGTDFSYEHTLPPTGGLLNAKTYHWRDNNPVPGDNFYRIRRVDQSGRMEYSRIVKVKMGNGATGIRVINNPVTDGIILIEIKSRVGGILNTRLLDSKGQIILGKTINHAPGSSIERLRPTGKLAVGVYHLEVAMPGNENIIYKVLVQ